MLPSSAIGRNIPEILLPASKSIAFVCRKPDFYFKANFQICFVKISDFIRLQHFEDDRGLLVAYQCCLLAVVVLFSFGFCCQFLGIIVLLGDFVCLYLVTIPPRITIHPAPEIAFRDAGVPVILPCVAFADPKPM